MKGDARMIRFGAIAIAAAVLGANRLALAAVPATAPVAPPPPPSVTMNLWPGDPPNLVEGAKPERDDPTGRIWNVSVPSMLVYLPARDQQFGHRTAIIACPGGGYSHLTRLVGADGAVNTFLPHGIVVIALKYRLSPPSAHVEADALADAKRAVRLVRAHAAEWGIDPHRVGLLGWSAGANLGLNLATRFDNGDPKSADPVERESSRPDFVALLSPWPHKHKAADYPVPKGAPPAFIGSALDDHTAPVNFARAVAANFEKAGATVHLSVVDHGGHGAYTIGAADDGGTWPARFLPWLEKLGLFEEVK